LRRPRTSSASRKCRTEISIWRKANVKVTIGGCGG
jgi:hypothetical protein